MSEKAAGSEVRQKWHCPAGLSGTGQLCTAVLVRPMLAAESALLEIINNSYMAVYKLLHILFTIHPNYLTSTCEANGEYTLLLLYFKESPLIAN